MLCRSWFRRSAVKLPAVPRILMACFAVLLAAPGLSAADEETNWTVLTVARNGNWGIARARTRSEAIAGALDRCQAMTADESDCGGELVAFRSGLALALMCGDHHVIVENPHLAHRFGSKLHQFLHEKIICTHKFARKIRFRVDMLVARFDAGGASHDV